VERILTIVDSRGFEFMSIATTPSPQSDRIESFYTVKVEAGPNGYVTRNGQRYELI